MKTCDMRGNSPGNTFTITREGETETFDSFWTLGHVVHSGTNMHCCAHRAREAGHEAGLGPDLKHHAAVRTHRRATPIPSTPRRHP